MPRRADDGVLSNGVITRTVQVMRPVIDVARTRLHDFLPLLAVPNEGDAAGGQCSQDLVVRNAAAVFDHHQIDKVLDVRQPLASQQPDGNFPVNSHFLQS